VLETGYEDESVAVVMTHVRGQDRKAMMLPFNSSVSHRWMILKPTAGALWFRIIVSVEGLDHTDRRSKWGTCLYEVF
jgi:hypothetical protein